MKTRWIVTVAFIVLAASGCASTSNRGLSVLDALRPTTTVTSETSPPRDPPEGRDAQATCENRVEDDPTFFTRSYRPSPALPDPRTVDDPLMQHVLATGELRVGVDENTLGFSARNASTGEIEGFEVDLAREIARRISPTARVTLVPVITDEKVPAARDGIVDMTISATSMSCSRWGQVVFSAEYFTANQLFLMRTDSPITSRADLNGKTVCVTRGSSSAKIMREQVPAADLLEVDARTDCLVALQRGEADAYFGHDSFVAGMLVQDPTLLSKDELLPEDVTPSHYGIAIQHGHTEFVRFVNGVLADLATTGQWTALYQAELEQLLGHPGQPPEPAYFDEATIDG